MLLIDNQRVVRAGLRVLMNERLKMKLRLIKAGLSPLKQKAKQLPDEIPASYDTIRSWVQELRRKKAANNRSEFTRIKESRAT